MPLLSTEANKLTNPSLQRGIVEIIVDRGARDLFAVLPFVAFQGESFAHVVETTIGTGNSARDPYGTSIPNTGGTNTRYETPVAMLIRNADTAKIDVVGKSDFNNQRANDIMKQAKKLAQDYLYQFINGRFSSSTTNLYNMRGLEHWIDTYNDSDQLIYWTDNDLVTGVDQNLSLNALDDLQSRYKTDEFDVMYTNRETGVYIKGLLNSAGGNTGGMLMSHLFGREMLHYNGMPIVISDAVGIQKTYDDATVTTDAATADTVTVNDTEFVGFSSIDVGSTITVDNDTAVIASVTSPVVCKVSATGQSGGWTTQANKTGNVASKNVVYACRFDEVDGIHAIYNSNRGVPANAGEYTGPIAGFDAEDMGLLEDSPRYRTRLDVFSNVVVRDKRAVARLSHYTLN